MLPVELEQIAELGLHLGLAIQADEVIAGHEGVPAVPLELGRIGGHLVGSTDPRVWIASIHVGHRTSCLFWLRDGAATRATPAGAS